MLVLAVRLSAAPTVSRSSVTLLKTACRSASRSCTAESPETTLSHDALVSLNS